MSSLDPNKKSPERKSLDPNSKTLNPEASRLRVNDVLKALNITHKHPTSPQANNLTVISSVFKTCDEEVLLKSLVGNSHFWSRFFGLVNKYAYSNSLLNSSISVLRAAEHMLLTTKNIPIDILVTFCNAFQGNLNIISIFTEELIGQPETTKMNVEIIRVVGNYMSCLNMAAKKSPDAVASNIAEFFLSVRGTGFLTTLSYIIEETPDEKFYELFKRVFITPLKTMTIFMAENKVSNSTLPFVKTLNDTIEKSFYLNKKTKSQFIEMNVECRDPTMFTILQLVDTITLLKDENLSLKKGVTEQLLFGKNPFPLISGCVGISNMAYEIFSELCKKKDSPRFLVHLLLNKEAIIFALVHKLTIFWAQSRSKTSADLQCLFDLLQHLIDKIDEALHKNDQESSALELTLEIINSMPYENLRLLQLKQLKNKQYQKWNQYASHFNTMLKKQAEEYVRQQRLFQLQTGTWVYSEDPTEYHVRHPKVYFLVLSDNQHSLLAREFKYRVERIPTVEQSNIKTLDTDAVVGRGTIVVPLKRIVEFYSRELQHKKKMPNHKRLINIASKTIYTEVKLLDKNSKSFLTFYLDNREASYIWLDGLQLVASQKQPKISKSTKSQIDTLIDIRKNIQMIGLNDYRFAEGFELDVTDDEQYYDLDTLSTLTEDFFYD